MPREKVFLSAEWQDLVMLNYEVDGKILSDYVPPGTVLDSFEGRTYVSLVGFRFWRTKLFGSFPIPFHCNFEEVNLRFYVRRRTGREERRGVVFIAEIVPRFAIAQIARLAYGENYVCLPMEHRVATHGTTKSAEYKWRYKGDWCRLYAEATGAAAPAEAGSLEQFIAEHYWGYSKQRNGSALEYKVAHAPWNIWAAGAAGFAGNVKALYGFELGSVLERRPDSAFIADGSPVVVFAGQSIEVSDRG